MSHTNGVFALERIQNMPPDEMYAHSRELLGAINQGVDGGLPLDAVKQIFADKLHINQGMDEQLSANISDGLIEGILAWERGERPVNSEPTEQTVAADNSGSEISEPPQTAQSLEVGQVGRLVAESATAQIKLRSEPSTDVPTHRYGLVGDRVLIQDSIVDRSGKTWYKVQFQASKAIGWVRGDFVEY